MPSIYENTTDTLGVFGESEEIPADLLAEQEITSAGEKWVKKADQNCRSANPDDCLIWCLQTTPARYGIPVVSRDISGNLVRQVVLLEKQILIQEGGHTEWKEVVCQVDLNPKLYKKIRAALNARGYNVVDTRTSGSNEDLNEYLLRFQQDNYLPLGQLDVETLSALGIEM